MSGKYDYNDCAPSSWPIVTVVAFFGCTFGTVLFINGVAIIGLILLTFGLCIFAFLLYAWFMDVIRENMDAHVQMDRSFRQGMLWFIVAECMLFTTFFCSLWYFRHVAMPWQNGQGYLGSTFDYLYRHLYHAQDILSGAKDALQWAENNGHSNLGGPFLTLRPLGVPLFNTVLLLLSVVTTSLALQALLSARRERLINLLGASIALALLFICLQAYTFGYAYASLNLTTHSGIYGSTFYLLVSVHTIHILIGATMLLGIWGRCVKGHFTTEHCFALEAVAWYWYFLVVVWLGLYGFVYWP